MDTKKLTKACRIWNRLTAPWKLRTDADHALCAARARRIFDAYLRPNLSMLHEWSNGALTVRGDA